MRVGPNQSDWCPAMLYCAYGSRMERCTLTVRSGQNEAFLMIPKLLRYSWKYHLPQCAASFPRPNECTFRQHKSAMFDVVDEMIPLGLSEDESATSASGDSDRELSSASEGSHDRDDILSCSLLENFSCMDYIGLHGLVYIIFALYHISRPQQGQLPSSRSFCVNDSPRSAVLTYCP